jgi:hypothetical protein
VRVGQTEVLGVERVAGGVLELGAGELAGEKVLERVPVLGRAGAEGRA